MSITNLLARGRARAEAMMVDTCTIRRRTGETIDPNTGATTPTWTDVYTGPCRVQFRGLATREATAGQQRVDLLSAELQLPITVTDVAVNDVAEITDSRDPDLPGTLLRVSSQMHGTHKTARRLPVQEVVS